MTSAASTSPRSLALRILSEVLLKKKFASERLDFFLSSQALSPPDRALVTQLVYGILREKEFLDHVLSGLIDFHKTPLPIQNLLNLGAYQLLFLDKVPDHAAIFETVELAKKKSGEQLGKFVNAVLRRIQEQREAFRQRRSEVLKNSSQVSELSWALSFPAWMVERWYQRLGRASTLALATTFNRVPPIYLRVNLKKVSVREMLGSLQEDGFKAEAIPSSPMLKVESNPEGNLKKYLVQGLISIQDLGSYRVAECVNAQNSELGLDACAGHGGKSTAIAEGSAGRVYVHEPFAQRLEELQDNFKRLSLDPPIVLQNPQQALTQGLQFDWILIDAPCSGMGTLGRKPEIRWRLKRQDLKRFQEGQVQILKDWLPALKKGGRLIYAVCSLEPEEGREVIQKILKDEKGLRGDFFQEWLPFEAHHDGFFVCRLAKHR